MLGHPVYGILLEFLAQKLNNFFKLFKQKKVLMADFAPIFAHCELCSALVVNFDVSKTMKMMMMRAGLQSRRGDNFV